MPKVITGAGLQEFIETGKHDVIKAEKKGEAKEAPALEVKKEVVVDVKPADEAKPEAKPEIKEDDGLEAEDKDLSEIIRKKIGKKHRAMKEAQEAAADAESFAKNQYDRARLAEERAAALATELEQAKKTVAPPPPEDQPPDEKDPKYQVNGQFDWKKFSSDQAEYVSDKKIKEYEARKAQEREAADKAEASARFNAKADKIDGFKEKLATSQVWFPNAVLEYITESEDGPEVVMHLLENPETADRISKLRPIKAIAEIGKIVKGFTKPEAKAVEPPQPIVDRGGAPPPITPISGAGTGTVNTDPAKMSFRELREFERAKRKKH